MEYQGTIGEYRWWNSSQILVFYRDDAELLMDIRTKATRPVNATVCRMGDNEMSPDRKMVIQQTWKGLNITWRITDPANRKQYGVWSIVSKTRMPGKSEVHGYWPPKAIWSEDGRKIYQIEYWPEQFGYQVTERSAARPGAGHAYPFAPERNGRTNLVVHDGMALVSPYDLDDQINPYDPDHQHVVKLREWSLAEPAQTTKEWNVGASMGMAVVRYVPSPDYRTALWVMGQPSKHPYSDGGYPYRAVSLWSSGLHGENMKEIGAIDFATNDELNLAEHYQRFGGLLWNPDGKHVSFIYYRKLYMVGV